MAEASGSDHPISARQFFQKESSEENGKKKIEGARHHTQSTLKKTACGCCGRIQMGWYDRRSAVCAIFVRRHADILELEVRRASATVWQGEAGTARLSGGQSVYTKRFASMWAGAAGGRRSRTWRRNWRWTGTRSGAGHATWKPSSNAWARLVRSDGATRFDPQGHTYRIVVSVCAAGRSGWRRGPLGGKHEPVLPGSAEEEFAHSPGGDGYVEAFSLATNAHAPQAAILFDKFHVIRHLGEALDAVRKSEYGRLRAASGATSRVRNTRCCRARRT